MAVFEYETTLPAAVERVFDFLARPANLALVAPPSPRVQLVAAPPRLTAGARFTARVSRFGLARLIESEVTWFEEGVGFTDEQVTGPFGRWVHTHEVEACPGGTLMRDRVEFEPPSGWLGWLASERRLRRALAAAFAFRRQRFVELFPPPCQPAPVTTP
jgi:ligand-binding SRPBCC domain-containing protein